MQMAEHQPDWEEAEVDRAYQTLTGSHPSIKNGGCGCLPFITVTLVGVILLFLLIAFVSLLLRG
jgi:hypothetical protein